MEESQDKATLLTLLAESFCQFLELDVIHQVLKDNDWNIETAKEILTFLANNESERTFENRRNGLFSANTAPSAVAESWIKIESDTLQENKINESEDSDDSESDISIESVEDSLQNGNDLILGENCTIKDDNNYLKKIHACPDKYEGYVPYERIKRTRESIERIKIYLRENVRIMVILRGLSGSGKSTLGKRIIDECGLSPNNYHHHIFSTDNYFMKNGKYEFDGEKLEEAHHWNQKNVFNCAKSGLTPIIIDNTNTRLWEMKVYAVIAVNKGYDIEIIEPDTSWAFNVNQLVKKSKHSVTIDSVKRVYDRYEHSITPLILLKENGLTYSIDNMPPQCGVKKLINEGLKKKLDEMKINLETEDEKEKRMKKEEKVREKKRMKEKRRKLRKESENKEEEDEKTKNEKLITGMILSFLDTDLDDSDSKDADSSGELKSSDSKEDDKTETSSSLSENNDCDGKIIKNDTSTSSELTTMGKISIQYDWNLGKFVNDPENGKNNESDIKEKSKTNDKIKSNASGVFKLKNTLSKDDVNVKRTKIDAENTEISATIKNELIGDTGSERYVNDLDGMDAATSSRFVNNLLEEPENRKINATKKNNVHLTRKLDNKDQKKLTTENEVTNKKVKNNLGGFLIDKQQEENKASSSCFWKYLSKEEASSESEVESKNMINKKTNFENTPKSSNLPWTETTEGVVHKDWASCDNNNSPFYGYSDYTDDRVETIESSMKLNEDRTFNRLGNIKKKETPRIKSSKKVNENLKQDKKKENTKNDLKVSNVKKITDNNEIEIDQELNEIFPEETISLIKTLLLHYDNMDDICNKLYIYGYTLSAKQLNSLINLGKKGGNNKGENESIGNENTIEMEEDVEQEEIDVKKEEEIEENMMKIIKALYEMCDQNEEKVKSCLEKQGYEITTKQLEQLKELESMKKEDDSHHEMEKERKVKETTFAVNEIKQEEKLVLLCLEKSFVNQIELIVGNNEENTFEDVPWVINVPVSLVKHLHRYLMESVSEFLDQKSRMTDQSQMKDYDFSLSRLLEDMEQSEVTGSGIKEFSSEEIISLHEENMGKLIALYPMLDEIFLQEVYLQSGYNFENTVKFLNCGVEDNSCFNSAQQSNSEWGISGDEEADRIRATTINDVEYLRERANHYKSQWGKCHLLHSDALKANNLEMAVYMKNIMNQHRQRYELCNAMAASSLCEKYDDGKHIDLHCFRLVEAIQVLDIAIDARIRKLMTSGDTKTDLFIITGRGKNSPGGKPVIKPAVMARLKTRGINCFVMKDINPGVIKAVIKKSCTATGNVKP